MFLTLAYLSDHVKICSCLLLPLIRINLFVAWKEAGISEEQAEAIAEAFRDANLEAETAKD